MIQQASIAAQRWYNIRQISGGQLSTKKCNYYVVTWDFAPIGRAKINSQEQPPMVIENHNDQPFHICNKSITENHNSLGYLQSMAKPKDYQQ
jgi:hypothetical protein